MLLILIVLAVPAEPPLGYAFVEKLEDKFMNE